MRNRGIDPREKTRYIPGLDGLRAVAVMMVLAYHLRLPAAKGGLLGVTIFFVISGFLITRILVAEIELTGTIDLKNFWLRRIRRLFPAILTMTVPLVFVSAVFNRVLFTKTCSDLCSAIFCYNNWWQIFNNISYFENAGAPSPLTHCWSLAVEAQFYLLYPLLLIALSRLPDRKKWFVRVTFALAVISLALMWILFDPAKDPSRVYYGTDTRAFSLLFGALLALIEKESPVRRMNDIFRNILGIAALAGLLFMAARIDGYDSFLYRGGQGIASMLTVFVIVSVLGRKSILGNLLKLYPLRWIGDRSYGIYLWHYPIILLISGGKKAPWWMCVIEILLTFLFAALSYRYIETPIRHGIIGKTIDIINSSPGTRRERKRQIRVVKKSARVLLAAFVVILGAALCVAFVPRESALNNIEELEAQAREAEEKSEEKAAQASAQAGASEPRTDEELLGGLDLLLIGDSIALGATDEFYEVFPGSVSDAAISRYTTESFAVYDAHVNQDGWDGDGVIFALGSNGLLYDSLSTLREMIGPDRPFFVITAKAPYTSWEESNNAEICQFAEATDNTYLVDWYRYSEGHGEYFDEDETHLSEAGAAAYVECIKEAVLPVYKNK